MPRTRTSLRFKLIIWMLFTWGLIQGTLTVVFWNYERRSTDEFFVDRLQTIAAQAAAEISSIPPPVRRVTLERVAARYSGTGMFDRVVFTVLGDDGEIIVAMELPASHEHSEEPNANPTDEYSIDATVLARLKQGEASSESALGLPSMVMTEGRVRSLARPLHGKGYEGQLLVIEAEEGHSTQFGHRFTQLLLGSILAGLLGVAVGATIISGIVTTPIARLNKTLQGLSPDTVRQTVPSGHESRELATVRRELEAARQRMERGFDLQDRFITNVSHELKSPISVLMAEAQTLPDLDKAQPEIRAFVDSVIKELRLLAGVVESFLLLSRVHGGQSLASDTTDYQINELLFDCVESSASIARLYDVSIAVTMLEDEGDLDLKVCGVPELLRIMLDNLIRNAIRFSPRGQTVELAVRRHEHEAVQYTVRDYGPGIPTETLENLFERFSRSRREAMNTGGVGLGLAIAQGIAELHDGRISVENCEDRGCRFTIILPLTPPQEECPDLNLAGNNAENTCD